MAFEVIQATAIRRTPAPDGELVRAVMPGEILKSENETSADWRRVSFTPPAGARVSGWVLAAHCKVVQGSGRPEVRKDGFVRTALMAERAFNQLPTTPPWYASADYVIARAIIETGLTNAGPNNPGSDAVGPLQVSSKEWGQFLQNGGEFSRNFDEDDRENAMLQVHAAIFRMHVDARAISEIKRQKGVGTTADPFLPRLLDVFHAYLTDSPAAAVAIRDAEDSATDKNKKLTEVLKGPLTEAQIAAVFEARSKFTGTIDAPKTVVEFAAGTEAALNAALKTAYELIKEHVPEELPKISQGEAAWLVPAQKAEADGIDEHNPAHKDIILDYFNATDHGRPGNIVPWCGAFAAHCMKSSGNADVAASIPRGAAAAASWKNWGEPIPVTSREVPIGAVVVLTPSPGVGGTGHVGFFTEFVQGGSFVRLLGGNQSDKVTRSNFPTSQIVWIGWRDLAPAVAIEQFSVDASGTPISNRAIDLIMEFEVSSKEVYERKYRKPIWPGVSSGVTIGIGYDVGHTSRQRLREDWAGVIPDAMITALESAVGVTGRPAAALAEQLKATVDVAWEAAKKVYLDRMLPRWTKVVEQALPNTGALSADRLGALVSLALNRGADFSSNADRRKEMRNIKAHMANSQFGLIPAELRAMKRLWPTVEGLKRRREAEAKLFESG
jgi:uncharacterized protein (TIGR02594 family)